MDYFEKQISLFNLIVLVLIHKGGTQSNIHLHYVTRNIFWWF